MTRLACTTLISLVLLSACATRTSRPDADASTTTPGGTESTADMPAANDNLNSVAWTQTSIERDLIYRQTYHDAAQQLQRALDDPKWDALPSADRQLPLGSGLKPAVILDIDETALDNSPYQARLILENRSYDEFSWAQWCHEENAQAVPGAVEFAQKAHAMGVTVFYLSNRARDLEQSTLDNLRKVGFPIAADETVFLGLGTVVPGCEQNGSEKGCRRQLIAQRHRVLVQVGDQVGDFLDVQPNTLSGRREAVAPYLDWVGERWFMLPNPTYGSWEPALFDNDRSKSPADQRRGKLAALRTR